MSPIVSQPVEGALTRSAIFVTLTVTEGDDAVEKLRELRASLGYTLAMLSEETGVELSTLSRIAAGKTKRPRAEQIKAIKAWMEKMEKDAAEQQ